MGLAFFACRGEETTAHADATSILREAERIAAADPTLDRLLAPRDGAWETAVDPESRGRLVSPGWRSTGEQRFSDLAARLPAAADGEVEIGISRFARMRLGVTLAHAGAASPVLHRGRVVYQDVLPATDRVFAAGSTEVEELLLLHGPEAPTRFAWKIQTPTDLPRVTEEDGGLAFRATRGGAALAIDRPIAIDARGIRRELAITWDATKSEMRIDVPHEGVVWPLLVDPTYRTFSWTQALPAPRSQHAMAYDEVRQEIVMFGGTEPTGDVAQTWIWNGAGWRRALPALSPSARTATRMAYDAARGRIVLFGGRNAGGSLRDTWTWDGTSWTLQAPAQAPPVRYSHALAYDRARSVVVLFGGFGASGALSDTWTWNGVVWTQALPAQSPPAQYNHVVAYDEVRSKVVMLAGFGSEPRTWLWSGTNWAPVFVASPPVPAASMSWDGNGMQILIPPSSVSPDTWTWNGSWTRRTTTLPGRDLSAMAYHAGQHRVVLFGGQDAGPSGETWEWDGASWARALAAVAPSARSATATAFDEIRNQVVLFGGFGAAGETDETWTWNGSTWSLQSTSPSPSARTGHAMTYDAMRGKVVLFGGQGGGNILSDTWLWNGGGWVQAASAAVGRSDHAMAFDAARGNVVAFGGTSSLGLPLGDTSLWNGTAWSTTTAVGPSARSQTQLVYDATRGKVVMFGGQDRGATFSDTWLWDGGAWSLATPTLRPGARYGHGMIYDRARGLIVLHAGKGSTEFSDTWLWDGRDWTQASTSTSPGARTGFAMAHHATQGHTLLLGGTSGGFLVGDMWLGKILGGTCAAAADCPTGFCVDGVCCDRGACNTCETCAGLSPGTCTAVTNREDSDTCALRDGKSCNDVAECKAALGAYVTDAAECASGHRVDGVCCDVAECGPCQTCDVAKKERALHPGQCDDARAGSDPREDCADDGVGTCKQNGQCDGHGACQLYASGTACGDNVCAGNRATGQFCTGAGECIRDPKGRECDTFACVQGACATTCTDATSCAPLHHCESGTCIADRGAACDGDHTVVSPTGERLDCGLYLCAGATCLGSCRSNRDCTGSADCTPDGQCVAFGSAGDDGDKKGCSCGVEPRSIDGFAAACGAAITGLCLRRSRRASRRAPRRGRGAFSSS